MAFFSDDINQHRPGIAIAILGIPNILKNRQQVIQIVAVDATKSIVKSHLFKQGSAGHQSSRS